GFGENFGHGLGHGVGLAVHEAPRLSTESGDTLRAGHAITIEPGIYLEGLGGVRIEDLAIVRDEGIDILTSFPKELTEVGCPGRSGHVPGTVPGTRAVWPWLHSAPMAEVVSTNQ